MDKNKANVPRIRFPGFNDLWEQRKLGDMVPITMGQSPDGSTYSDTPSDYILVQGNADLKNGWVTPRIWTSQVTKKAEAGDLIMSVRAPAGKMGKTAYNVVIGRGVAAIKGNEFIFQSLVKMNGEGYWKKLSCGSTFESLNSDNIKNAEIMIPNLDEQAQIGVFFKGLDNLSALHQRKLNHLQDKKKSLLQKMFPKNGEDFPELRFPGFTDPWEQRKLSEIATIKARIGWQGLTQKEFLDEGDYYLITGTDFDNGQIDLSNCHYISKERYNQDANIQVKNGDVLITKDGTIGKVAYIRNMDKPATLNAGVFVIKGKDKSLSDLYLYHYLAAPFLLDYADKRATGGTIKHLNQNVLVSFPIPLPKVKEQKEIGQFFSKIDNLITLHQRKLNHLQEQKKSLLQQMFI